MKVGIHIELIHWTKRSCWGYGVRRRHVVSTEDILWNACGVVRIHIPSGMPTSVRHIPTHGVEKILQSEKKSCRFKLKFKLRLELGHVFTTNVSITFT